MTGKQAIKILRRYNKWRRGGKGKQPDPKQVGEAIDVAVVILSHYAKSGELDRVQVNTKTEQKQALIDMMRGDEEIGLYDDNPKNH